MTEKLADIIGPWSEGAAGKRQIAVFDFDGTCINGDAPVALFRYLGAKRMLKLSSLLKISVWGVGYKFKVPMNEEWVRCLLFEPFSGRPVEEVDEYFRWFYDEYIEPRFRPQVDAAMRAHIEAGHAVICVSASFQPMILAAMAHHPIQYQISTVMQIDANGNYTNKVKGVPVSGRQKPIALQYFADGLFGKDRWELGFAYGDHHTDRFLLEQARNVYAVTPDQPLKRLAKRKGWTILDWDAKKDKDHRAE